MDIIGILVALWIYLYINGKSIIARGFQLSALWYTYTILCDAVTKGNAKVALTHMIIMLVIFAPSIMPYVARFLLKIIRGIMSDDTHEEGEIEQHQQHSDTDDKDTTEKENRIKRILAELSKQKEKP